MTELRGNRRAAATQAEAATSPVIESAGETLALLAAVRTLPARQREAVVLRYYADLSEGEVAHALGCSVGTVKSQLAKARATLASRLTEEARSGG